MPQLALDLPTVDIPHCSYLLIFLGILQYNYGATSRSIPQLASLASLFLSLL
jgi:hypothetical protein